MEDTWSTTTVDDQLLSDDDKGDTEAEVCLADQHNLAIILRAAGGRAARGGRGDSGPTSTD